MVIIAHAMEHLNADKFGHEKKVDLRDVFISR